MADLKLQGTYFREQLLKGISAIYAKQQSVAAGKIGSSGGRDRSRSSALMESLTAPDYTVSVRGGGVAAVLNYPISIRFSDMKHLGNWKVYNKPIWGTIYRETIPDIRYEFSTWIREHTKESLTEAFKPLNMK